MSRAIVYAGRQLQTLGVGVRAEYVVRIEPDEFVTDAVYEHKMFATNDFVKAVEFADNTDAVYKAVSCTCVLDWFSQYVGSKTFEAFHETANAFGYRPIKLSIVQTLLALNSVGYAPLEEYVKTMNDLAVNWT